MGKKNKKGQEDKKKVEEKRVVRGEGQGNQQEQKAVKSKDPKDECAKSVVDFLKKVKEKILKEQEEKGLIKRGETGTTKQKETDSHEPKEPDLLDVFGKYLFRGVSNSEYEVQSSAYRKIIGDKDLDSERIKRFIEHHRSIVDGYRARGYHYKNGVELSVLEILAELQHSEKETTFLTDFTKNALVALYFAVGDKEKDKKQNSRVYFIDNAEWGGRFRRITYEHSNFFDFDKLVDDFLLKNDENLYFWEARRINERIPAQHSVFVLDNLNFKDIPFFHVDICKDARAVIRDELETLHNMSGVTLFNDEDGYKKYKDAYKDSKKGRIRESLYALQGGFYNHAIEILDELVKEFSEDINLLMYRAGLKNLAGDLDGAIDDYSKIVKSNLADAECSIVGESFFQKRVTKVVHLMIITQQFRRNRVM